MARKLKIYDTSVPVEELKSFIGELKRNPDCVWYEIIGTMPHGTREVAIVRYYILGESITEGPEWIR